MTGRFIALATFALLMSACGGAATPPAAAPDAPAAKPKEESAPPEKVKADPEKVEGAGARLNQRRVGDYALLRISSSYRHSPLLLSEEVVKREDGYLVVDYTLEEGKTKTRLRTRMIPETGEVVRVSRMEGSRETAAELSDYQAMMDQTVFTPDYNDGAVGRKRATCLVAGKEAQCVTTRYHIYVGDQPATLSVTTSASLPGRDVEGSIQDARGGVIYQSELVETRRGAPEPSLARRDAGLRYVPPEL
jgi:hypothetical protein